MEQKSENINKPSIPLGAKTENTFVDVVIKSRKKEYYRGQVHTLTSINEKGEFDVLPYHANFITLIKDYIILDKKKTGEQKISIEKGVLSVEGNKVEIYLDL